MRVQGNMQWTVVGWFHDSFIEIEFEYHMIHSFEAYINNSVDFGILTRLSNHHLYLIPEHSITPKGNPIPIP